MKNSYTVYMITNWMNEVLYTGVTNDLERRLSEHRLQNNSGFSARYKTAKLVWQESYPEPTSAIAREKQLKGWKRFRKNALVAEQNPEWRDLSADWYAEDPSLRSG